MRVIAFRMKNVYLKPQCIQGTRGEPTSNIPISIGGLNRT